MHLIPDIVAMQEQLTRWRHDLHAHPELAYEESRTADFVAEKLRSFGIEVTMGFGKTGVVGSLTVGDSTKAIGIRADMDALPMEEANTFAHKSTYPGKMHGCGHDGHTVMLLAAAQYLSRSRNFKGTVQFIFQPAEEANEIGSGAKAMLDDGLLERFPMDSVYALHNAPGIEAGTVIAFPGPFAAAMDLFEVTLTGKGAHGATPDAGTDSLLVGAHLITAWQSIVSRNIAPAERAVVSVTSLQSGDSWNVLPEVVTLRGSIRTLSDETQATVKQRFYQLTQQVAAAFDTHVDIHYDHATPVLLNDEEQTAIVTQVATSVVGADYFQDSLPITGMGSEDFAYLSQARPSCYFLLGAGGGEGGCLVHQPCYDFNDEIIPVGASVFVRLAEHLLPA